MKKEQSRPHHDSYLPDGWFACFSPRRLSELSRREVLFPLCHLFYLPPPPPETGGILVNLSTLPSSQLCPPSLGSLHHSPSQGFSAMRSSGQSSQVICETTAREAIISYCGHQEPASQGLCCLWTWTDWMRLQTSLRPQASSLSSREGSNSPCVFSRLISSG